LGEGVPGNPFLGRGCFPGGGGTPPLAWLRQGKKKAGLRGQRWGKGGGRLVMNPRSAPERKRCRRRTGITQGGVTEKEGIITRLQEESQDGKFAADVRGHFLFDGEKQERVEVNELLQEGETNVLVNDFSQGEVCPHLNLKVGGTGPGREKARKPARRNDRAAGKVPTTPRLHVQGEEEEHERGDRKRRDTNPRDWFPNGEGGKGEKGGLGQRKKTNTLGRCLSSCVGWGDLFSIYNKKSENAALGRRLLCSWKNSGSVGGRGRRAYNYRLKGGKPGWGDFEKRGIFASSNRRRKPKTSTL